MANVLALQSVRYVINGIGATLVHYGVLNLCIHFLNLAYAGIANLIAATVGISVSFLGNRYFVFSATVESIWRQLLRFWLLYVSLAVMQSAVMFVWADLAGLDFRVGFLIGTAIQMAASYFGGKQWIFKS